MIERSEVVVKKLICNHSKVAKIWEYGALAGIPTGGSGQMYRVVALLMKDGSLKEFSDDGESDKAIIEAEKWLSEL